jgi:hypothetical protein
LGIDYGEWMMDNGRKEIEKRNFMKLELKYQTNIVFLLALITLIPKISTGQDSLQAVETARDSSITSINLEVVTDSSLLPSEKTKSKENNINYWGTAGGTLVGWFGELDVNINKQIFSIQYTDFIARYSSDWDNPGPRIPSRKELGVLYGRILTEKQRKFYSSLSAGISRLAFSESTNNKIVYGCPIKCEIMYHGKYVGIGVSVTTNINSESSDLIGYYIISIGRLK